MGGQTVKSTGKKAFSKKTKTKKKGGGKRVLNRSTEGAKPIKKRESGFQLKESENKKGGANQLEEGEKNRCFPGRKKIRRGTERESII